MLKTDFYTEASKSDLYLKTQPLIKQSGTKTIHYKVTEVRRRQGTFSHSASDNENLPLNRKKGDLKYSKGEQGTKSQQNSTTQIHIRKIKKDTPPSITKNLHTELQNQSNPFKNRE